MALPIGAIELAFLASNLTKLHEGGYVPVALAAVLAVVMISWWRGTQVMLAKVQKLAVSLSSFRKSMAKSSVPEVSGTAFYLTPDPDTVPSSLLHSLKHFRTLHDNVVLLTVETLRVPNAEPSERVTFERLDDRFSRLTLRFGFMETPNVARGLAAARKAGLKFDVMTSTFFLSRRRPVVTAQFGMGQVMDGIFAQLTRMATDPTDYYRLPRDRVVELGYRVAI